MNARLASNTVLFSIGLGLITLLYACHENPLSQQEKSISVAFLQQAARFAEDKMRLPKEAAGLYYINCMTGNSESINCDAYFKHMQQFAKQHPLFKAVGLNDLSDIKVFASLEEDYRIQLFNTDPSEE